MTIFILARRFWRTTAVSSLAVLLACAAALPASAQSTNHVVSSQALQQQLQTQSATRQKDITTVTNFFSSPMAKHAMQMEHVSSEQVKTAIPTLSNSELASLSSRANQAQQQFAAGNLSETQMLLLIVVLLIVVLLVAVH